MGSWSRAYRSDEGAALPHTKSLEAGYSMALPPRTRASVSEVWRARAILGKAPVWDARTGQLYWVAIKGRRLHAYGHHHGTFRSWALPFRLCSVAPAVPPWRVPAGLSGDLIIGCGDPGLMWIAIDGDQVTIQTIALPNDVPPGNRFNDGKIGIDGRYWTGTMDDAESEANGRLYAFAADGSWRVMDDGYRVSNGSAFSRDGQTVYHTDSARKEIYAFDLAPDGTLGPRRLLRRFGLGEGCPDGMTVDADGNLWVAMWDGWRVQRLGPDGADRGAVPMPTARCTSCVFVEPDVLYVTSATVGVEGQACAGSLYRVTLD